MPQNVGGKDLIGQYTSRATHTHYFPHRPVNQVIVCTVSVAPFVSPSGSINVRNLLQLERSLHPCQCEQPQVSRMGRQDLGVLEAESLALLFVLVVLADVSEAEKTAEVTRERK